MILTGRMVTGECEPALEPLDRAMVRCMAEHNVPGASLAVARDGKLVVSRGYGWADLQALVPVQPDSLFRIASVSKSITSVAVMRLVEGGKLSLDDRFCDILGLEPADPRVATVTICQCLQHTGGWDRSRSFDPMFFSRRIAEDLGIEPPPDPDAIIRWMMGKPLQWYPGTVYAYSNFGYCLLGRVIEKLTGAAYEAHVKEHVLQPTGATSTKLGATLTRAPGEVAYYPATEMQWSVFSETLGLRVPHPYGAWSIEAMDAHGGWIASAPDLVLFASGIGRVLKPETIARMFERPPAPVATGSKGEPLPNFYACGWAVDPGQQHHNGMLMGTAAVLRRRDAGICWAALFNAALGRHEEYIGAAIVPMVNEVLG